MHLACSSAAEWCCHIQSAVEDYIQMQQPHAHAEIKIKKGTITSRSWLNFVATVTSAFVFQIKASKFHSSAPQYSKTQIEINPKTGCYCFRMSFFLVLFKQAKKNNSVWTRHWRLQKKKETRLSLQANACSNTESPTRQNSKLSTGSYCLTHI